MIIDVDEVKLAHTMAQRAYLLAREGLEEKRVYKDFKAARLNFARIAALLNGIMDTLESGSADKFEEQRLLNKLIKRIKND